MNDSALSRAAMIAAWLLCLGTVHAFAQDTASQLRLTPNEITFPPPAGGQTGTSGVNVLQVKVLSGDPKQAGLYTMIIKAPPNMKIKPHAHPDNRVSVVVSGTFHFAYGDEFDEAKLKALPAGSFYTEPPGANHFAMTKDEGVTLYISGTGPTGTVYVNPADDPTKK